MARPLVLVGSVGLETAEQVFRTVAGSIGDRLKRMPDGETGVRSKFTAWQRKVVAEHPDFAPAADGLYTPTKPEVAFATLGFADAAIASYTDFTRLRREGVIRPGLRFQVALPTTAAFLYAHVTPGAHAAVEGPYEAALFAELDRILATIPAADLAIQWDVDTEVAQWEGVRFAYFPDIRTGAIDRLARHAARVPAGVELGFHLCYGDTGHKHWLEPRDTGVMAEMIQGIAARLDRPIDWVHLPVPRGRDDEAYFAPLAVLPPGVPRELYLGLIHLSDGEAGTARRIAAAKPFLRDFGIATECGFGRRPPETIPALLELHKAVG